MFFFSKLFKRQSKASSAAVLNISGQNLASWSDERYDIYSKEGYLYNVIAHACIDKICKSVASVPWKLFEKKYDGSRVEIETKLIKRPNPSEGLPFLILKTMAYLIISGTSFIERVAPSTGANKGIPLELYTHRPDRFKINLSEQTGQIANYEYNIGGNIKRWEVDPITLQSDILQLKLFNPLDDLWGIGLMRAAAREIDTSNEAITWNKSLLEKQGRPGLIFFMKEILGDKEFKKFEKSIIEKFSGGRNTGKTLIVEGEGDVKPYGWSPTDMDFIKGHIEVVRRICNGFEVPPQLLGIPDASKFSNYKEARLAFWEDTILYYLTYLRGEFNNWLFKKDDRKFFDYILDDISALTPRRDLLWDRANASSFISINEKREMVGKDSWGTDGDVILIPAGMIPLGMEEDLTKEIDKEKTDKQIKEIIEQGYTKTEALELLGLSIPD